MDDFEPWTQKEQLRVCLI